MLQVVSLLSRSIDRTVNKPDTQLLSMADPCRHSTMGHINADVRPAGQFNMFPVSHVNFFVGGGQSL